MQSQDASQPDERVALMRVGQVIEAQLHVPHDSVPVRHVGKRRLGHFGGRSERLGSAHDLGDHWVNEPAARRRFGSGIVEDDSLLPRVRGVRGQGDDWTSGRQRISGDGQRAGSIRRLYCLGF